MSALYCCDLNGKMSKQTVGVGRLQDASQEFTFKPYPSDSLWSVRGTSKQRQSSDSFHGFAVSFCFMAKCGRSPVLSLSPNLNLVLIIVSNYKGEKWSSHKRNVLLSHSFLKIDHINVPFKLIFFVIYSNYKSVYFFIFSTNLTKRPKATMCKNQ